MWLWDAAAAIALLWPHRITGLLHGLPLDGLPDIVALGVAPPLLWCAHRRFLATRAARLLILALLAWKGFSAAALVQDGWCVRVIPSRPYAKDAQGAPHSWDIRADWRSPDPACSAIMTRPYHELREFPVWFFNLPPVGETRPDKEDLPPGAHLAMTIQGFLYASRGGVFHVDAGDDMTTAISADGRPFGDVRLEPGLHRIVIDSSLTGDRWRLVPTVDGADLWARATPTVRRPSNLDLILRPWGRWITAGLAGTFMLAWTASAVGRVRQPAMLAWSIGASLLIGTFTAIGADAWARWAIAALACGAFVPVSRRLQNMNGALLCIGIPWLVYVVVRSAPLAGRFTLYSWGDDFWTFQRYAYRIVMLGYWLEGGSPTFWFQPLYRWIAGILHLVFGDSSIGEAIWDGACVLVGALAAFRITQIAAGFRWGLIAAALSLAVFVLTAASVWMGVGLSEISSAGFIYLAACVGLERRREVRAWLLAGVLATLGFYARLNNLFMACGVAAYALPSLVPARELIRPQNWIRQVAWRMVLSILAPIAIGMLLLAWRAWHFTSVFSVFYGTQRDLLSIWKPGMPWSEVVRRMIDSVMMVLTVTDPVRFDPFALPVLIGASVALLSIVGVPRMSALPLSTVLFFLSSIAGALVARGSAYSGRFSVHVIPIACALTTCGAAALTKGKGPEIRSSRSLAPTPLPDPALTTE